MNLDDESLLSGYLDGELDPAQRAWVETALAANPELVALLHEIEAMRLRVRGLSRPLAPRDVTANVMARVSREPRARLYGLLRAHPRRVGAGLAAAAALMFLAVRPPHLGGRPPRVEPAGEGRVAVAVEREPVATADASADPGPEQPTTPRAPAPPDTLVEADPPQGTGHDHERIMQAMLDRPNVQRLVVVVDEITPQTLRSVEDALEATPRIEPLQGCLRIGQGITIDPSRPGEAVVYAVVLDDNELTNLQAQLARWLRAGQIAATVGPAEPAEPAVVTQLADLGPSYVREGRAASPGLFETPPMPMALSAAPADLPTQESLQAEANASMREADPARLPDPPVSFPRRVTLVWITTRSGDHGPTSPPPG